MKLLISILKKSEVNCLLTRHNKPMSNPALFSKKKKMKVFGKFPENANHFSAATRWRRLCAGLKGPGKPVTFSKAGDATEKRKPFGRAGCQIIIRFIQSRPFCRIQSRATACAGEGFRTGGAFPWGGVYQVWEKSRHEHSGGNFLRALLSQGVTCSPA